VRLQSLITYITQKSKVAPQIPAPCNQPFVIPSPLKKGWDSDYDGFHSHDYVVSYVKRDFDDVIKVPNLLASQKSNCLWERGVWSNQMSP